MVSHNFKVSCPVSKYHWVCGSAVLAVSLNLGHPIGARICAFVDAQRPQISQTGSGDLSSVVDTLQSFSSAMVQVILATCS